MEDVGFERRGMRGEEEEGSVGGGMEEEKRGDEFREGETRGEDY